MASRSSQKQREHDNVLAGIVRLRWRGSEGRVYSNPDGEKNCAVNYRDRAGRVQQVYPDIVVLETTTNTVRCVGEVETPETVTEAESPQWRDYAKIGGECYLYVPSGTEQRAKQLLSRAAGIRLRRYYFGPGGLLNIENLN